MKVVLVRTVNKSKKNDRYDKRIKTQFPDMPGPLVKPQTN